VIALAIVLAEVGFWFLIAAGLLLRYPLRRPRAGLVLLASAPVVDVLLLGFVTWDLAHGATATSFHALSAVYIGVSVAFGHRMVRWADVRFAHRFAGGPPPAPKPTGAARTRAAREGWLRHLLAWSIGVGLLVVAIVVVGDADRTAALRAIAQGWTVVLLVDAAFSLPATRPASPDRRPATPTRR
jgi:hypothetical protein